MFLKEIAALLGEGEAAPKTLKAKAARARKRFERLKARLKQDHAAPTWRPVAA